MVYRCSRIIEGKVNITLVINKGITHKKDSLFSSTKRSNICKMLWIFLSVTRNIGKNVGKNISKTLSSKHSQKFLDHHKQSATLKTASKMAEEQTKKKQQKQLVI